jgi:hypothetical protein
MTGPGERDATALRSSAVDPPAGLPDISGWNGANLARREITVAFDEIRRRLPDLHITGEPDYLQSNFINGIERLPCAW